MVIDNRIHKEFNGSDHVPIELEIDLSKLNHKNANNDEAKVDV